MKTSYEILDQCVCGFIGMLMWQENVLNGRKKNSNNSGLTLIKNFFLFFECTKW